MEKWELPADYSISLLIIPGNDLSSIFPLFSFLSSRLILPLHYQEHGKKKWELTLNPYNLKYECLWQAG